MMRFILWAVMFTLSIGNVWDNIYSQSMADTPIILSESINFDFHIKEYNLMVNIDFNANLQILTGSIYYDLLLIKMEVLTL